MKFIRKYLKVWSAFVTVQMIFSLVLPNVSWALTAGPTSPEYSSFEPVDMTDMVNLTTGDFIYNIPLVEVPGPAGNYPVSLSYHAGIQPGVEASWVGLGWSLNPGAINRLVNGYPDDHKEVGNVVRDFWVGGESVSTTVGASYGFAVGDAAGASVSAGLVFANDTYQGKGVGAYLGAGLTVGGYTGTGEDGSPAGPKLGLNSNIRLDISPYGGMSASSGIGVGLETPKSSSPFSGKLDLSLSSSGGLSAKTGLSYKKSWQNGEDGNKWEIKGDVIGATWSSGGKGFSVKALGGSAKASNSKSGNISSISNSWNIPIPTPVPGLSFQIGRSYYRYWSDETETTKVYGALYNDNINPGQAITNHKAYDSYDVVDALERDLDPKYQPIRSLDGTFADTDHYSVLGQGVSGSIKPYSYRQYLNRQMNFRENEDGDKIYNSRNYYLGHFPDRKLQFRFEGDFSNRLEYEAPAFAQGSGSQPLSVNIAFDGQLTTGSTGSDSWTQAGGLYSRQPVEWKTNQEFLVGSNPVILGTDASGFDRSTKPADQIGGFSITNESGITYHYALPVYSYAEHIYQERIDDSGGESFNHLSKYEPYAYTWLLTAVTGPDYLDYNQNNLADEGDWGYWVNLNYGKWVDDYQWRNPGQGFNRDLDDEFRSFSTGKKELYYLDAIETQTHTAIFVKDIRKDGKSNTLIGGPVTTNASKTDVTRDEGSFMPRRTVTPLGDVDMVQFPRPSLKLEEIILVENENLPFLDKTSSASQNITHEYIYDVEVDAPFDETEIIQESNLVEVLNWDHVIDTYDRDQLNLRDHAIKTVDLLTDYSLVPSTSNSFDNNLYQQLYPSSQESSYANRGKLTLKGLRYGGHQGVSIVPNTTFAYASPNPVFNRFKVDNWGFYKSDHPGEWDNSNFARATTKVSAPNVDAWSMTSVTNSLGSTTAITYESDDYSRSVLAKNTSMVIEDIVQDQDEFTMTIQTFGADLNDLLDVDSEILADIMVTFYVSISASNQVAEPKVIKVQVDPETISNNQITFRDNNLQGFISSGYFGPGQVISRNIAGGNVSFTNTTRTCGGGLRVKEIALNDPFTGVTQKTKYDYRIPGLDRSSGVTSYEPIIFDNVAEDLSDKEELALKSVLYKDLNDLLRIARHVPGPGVQYEYVTTQLSVVKDGQEVENDNYSTHHFQVFDASMIDIDELDYVEVKDGAKTVSESQQVRIHDMTAQIGSLKSVSLFNQSGYKLSETVNHYLFDPVLGQPEMDEQVNSMLDVHNRQGKITETYANARWVSNSTVTQDGTYYGVISQNIKYPLVPTGQTNYNYLKGGKQETRNLAFDFFSGQPVERYSEDIYGHKYVSQSIPAYRLEKADGSAIYPFMNMKNANPLGKNMLTQEGASFTFRVDDNFDPEASGSWETEKESLVSATVQAWQEGGLNVMSTSGLIDQDNFNIYRKQTTYSYVGDGATNADGTFSDILLADDFHLDGESNAPVAPEKWRKSGEATLYDVYSHVLEASDVNGNFAATKFDAELYRVYASVSGANYNEFAFSGAEDGGTATGGPVAYGGDVNQPNGVRSTQKAHTGDWSVRLTGTGTAFQYQAELATPRPLLVSVWSTDPGVKLVYNSDGQGEVLLEKEQQQAGTWYLISGTIPASNTLGSTVEVKVVGTGTTMYVDDFRVHPIDAVMTSYVYNEWGELSDVLDDNNFFTHYEYNEMGKLKSITRETTSHGPVMVGETTIHYANQQ